MSRLLKSTAKVLKIYDYEIEQLKEQISMVNQQITLRSDRIKSNRGLINTERLIASVNTSSSQTLGAFIKATEQKNILLQDEIIELQAALEKINDMLLNLFRESKTYEILHGREKKRIKTEVAKAEQKSIDELNVQKYAKR